MTIQKTTTLRNSSINSYCLLQVFVCQTTISAEKKRSVKKHEPTTENHHRRIGCCYKVAHFFRLQWLKRLLPNFFFRISFAFAEFFRGTNPKGNSGEKVNLQHFLHVGVNFMIVHSFIIPSFFRIFSLVSQKLLNITKFWGKGTRDILLTKGKIQRFFFSLRHCAPGISAA